MAQKLTWEEIKQQYDGEWVELVDCDWDDSEQDPRSGIVRVHSKDKKEFRKLILQDRPKSSALLYVGDINFSEGVVFSANLHQFGSSK
jgi:hypothetical protein